MVNESHDVHIHYGDENLVNGNEDDYSLKVEDNKIVNYSVKDKNEGKIIQDRVRI